VAQLWCLRAVLVYTVLVGGVWCLPWNKASQGVRHRDGTLAVLLLLRLTPACRAFLGSPPMVFLGEAPPAGADGWSSVA
jgi:hypothetical protein